MKVAIFSGSRDYPNRELVRSAVHMSQANLVIHGACPTGVDAFVQAFCTERQDLKRGRFIPHPVPAEWRVHGKKAGPTRNHVMAELGALYVRLGHEVVCHCFPLGGGGTENFIAEARIARLSTMTYTSDGHVRNWDPSRG